MLLDHAARSRDARDVQSALIIGHAFGFAPEHAAILCTLVEADWHVSHEDVVSALDKLRTSDAADALFRATQGVPKYLEYDENRALAVKAIWALGRIPGTEVKMKLETIRSADNAILRKAADEQLQRRSST